MPKFISVTTSAKGDVYAYRKEHKRRILNTSIIREVYELHDFPGLLKLVIDKGIKGHWETGSSSRTEELKIYANYDEFLKELN